MRRAPGRTGEIGPIHRFVLDSKSVGAKSFRMGIHVLPAGRQTTPHHHDVESAVYMVRGGAIVFVGEDQEPVPLREGDFLYIPAGEIHSAYNPSRRTHVSVVLQAGSKDEAVGTYERPDLKPKGLKNLDRRRSRANPRPHR